jgi:hypothetical protein
MSIKKATTKPESRRSIAKRHGITAITLDAWELEGIDIRNDSQLAARATMKHGNNTPTMQAAKLRKLLAEARSAELKAMLTEGKMISLEDVCQCLTKIGCTLRAQLSKLRADLPPVIYGMNQGDTSKAIAAAVERILQSICDELEEVKTEPPRPD